MLFAIAAVLRVLVIFSSPSPPVDVFAYQKIAPIELLSGNNPYSIIYPINYDIKDVFPYGPAVIFLNMPAVLFTGDPRYTMAAAELGTALLIFIILRKTTRLFHNDARTIAELFPLIFLFHPKALYILAYAWVDSLLIFTLTLFVFLLIFLGRKNLAFVVFGLAICTKQYSIFSIPFLLNSRLIRIRDLFISFVTASVLVIPFLIWNAKDFLKDLVLFHPLTTKHSFFYISLSFNNLLHELTGYGIPALVIIFIGILVLLYLLRIQEKLKLSGVFLATATLSLSIFLFSKIAFIHYYYFSGSLIFLSIVIIIVEASKNSHRLQKDLKRL